ncbi:flagellar motor stator protein MotA [Paenibacillus mucilaginosus]|uniref:MotA/TolQ/ExbB proton channel n=3 Tax=Paenibacillus mucilaginosus TaxID=61624 RepID=H6N8Z1_9BACL|nr:flagellar motor stator protein MotA [Paenibacillus mucilaginosus]AEI39479.1 MotA/TolQ/ExbB proton channel [Paenibacillus mucilaginosus KNP414]AFC27737.1 MotA/TolQ/ExbB proton channel [Paenibacillus mucilaginosus 3016]AFH59892.1 flagellar motor protein MotA [Paenibacillus mucilaginosus K02]MCG7214694.1 flagellar motor stator protein MotA [Paenibacillus mucilaginosus]WDM28446.1 flagellar motor stator protein MotA [Paenibacillus mucilaginosus]
MDKSSYLGVALGLIAVLVGMVLKGASIGALLNPAAFMIILVGTAAAVIIAFPMNDLKKFPKLLGILFKEQVLPDKKELMDMFIEWVSITRREGLLALESKVDAIEEPFLRNGMRMIIDGNDQDFVRDVLLEEISAAEERHRTGALIFTQAGTYAPTLGVLGAVIGLVAALGNLSEVDKLGHLISAAFIATMLGIFFGYVIFHPMSNKLKQKAKKEAEVKMMMVEGLLSIQSGISAIAVKQKLTVFISPSQRDAEDGEKGGAGGE